MADRREITPAELAVVFQLAASMPDLTVLPAELAELASLRKRVVRGEAAIRAVAATQSDLMLAIRQLAAAKVIDIRM